MTATGDRAATPPARRRGNGLIAAALVLVVAGMVGLAYAAVPLYRIFCQVTGFAGTTRVASGAPDSVGSLPVTVRFDANVARNLDWGFAPQQRAVEIKPGETKLALYRATNRADTPSTGTATFNVTPDWTGQYFNKVQCFCFTEQTLAPGESVDMPVAFFIDPKIADDRQASDGLTITLSYTFYPAGPEPETTAAAPASRPGG